MNKYYGFYRMGRGGSLYRYPEYGIIDCREDNGTETGYHGYGFRICDICCKIK